MREVTRHDGVQLVGGDGAVAGAECAANGVASEFDCGFVLVALGICAVALGFGWFAFAQAGVASLARMGLVCAAANASGGMGGRGCGRIAGARGMG